MRSKLKFHLVEEHPGAKIKVIGLGGGGGNAINRMIEANIEGVEFIAVNTDLQALNNNKASRKVQIGNQLTKGLGSGGRPDIGKEAAMEDTEKLLEIIEGADMVFLTSGLGGGTGTGVTPILANLAAEKEILTIAITTLPFSFEGKIRMDQAEEGLASIGESADTVIAIPNERLLETITLDTSLNDAFRMADDVLRQAVQGISDLIIKAGFINLDFADVKSIMKDVKTMMKGSGNAFMGTGLSSGENRAEDAAKKAISSPLLIDTSIEGARGVLMNITGGKDITLHEVSKASQLMQNLAHPEANIIFGIVLDEGMKEKDIVKVTVIATGFDQNRLREGFIPKHTPPYKKTPEPVRVPIDTPPYLFEPVGNEVKHESAKYGKEYEHFETPAYQRKAHDSIRKTPNETS